MKIYFYFSTKKNPLCNSAKRQIDKWSMRRIWVCPSLTEAGFQALQRAAALIFTTSSHFFSLCQQHCESVSHSYAATDGPISLLQLSCWHDSWGSVSWFRVSFIFLFRPQQRSISLRHPRGSDPGLPGQSACLRGKKKKQALLGKTGPNTHAHTLYIPHTYKLMPA